MKACFSMLVAAATALAASPARIVMVAGTPSHAPGEHEFNAGTLLLEKCLRQNRGVETVVVKGGWPEDEKVFDGASAVVLYMDGGAKHPLIMGDRLDIMGKLMHKGVGLACLHYAVEVPKEKGGPELLDWIGGYLKRAYSQNPIKYGACTPDPAKPPNFPGREGFSRKEEWVSLIAFRPDYERVT